MEAIKLKMSPMKWYSESLEQSTFSITFPFIWRKSEPRFRENQENSIRPKQAQSQMCKLIIAYLMMLSYLFIVIEIY